MFGVAENVSTFLERSMNQWKLSLTSSGEVLGLNTISQIQ